jgi:hypothetical protein
MHKHIAVAANLPRPAWQSGAWQPARQTPGEATDAAFVALQQGYRASGGLLRGDDFSGGQGRGADGDGGYIALARRLVAGQLFSFHWHDSSWLPLFQFEPDRCTLREAPQHVLGELREVLDGWGLAHWYLKPHPALGRQCPLDRLATDPGSVLAAARADRAAATSA